VTDGSDPFGCVTASWHAPPPNVPSAAPSASAAASSPPEAPSETASGAVSFAIASSDAFWKAVLAAPLHAGPKATTVAAASAPRPPIVIA
jgi:hypothetical protein